MSQSAACSMELGATSRRDTPHRALIERHQVLVRVVVLVALPRARAISVFRKHARRGGKKNGAPLAGRAV